MLQIKFSSREISQDEDATSTTIIHNGTYEEVMELAESQRPGSSSDMGHLRSVRIYQEAPNIWACERVFMTDQDGELPSRPNKTYGKKSAQLRGSMLSMPLKKHPNYLTCWDHYLFAAPGTSGLPSWWDTATDVMMSAADSKKYSWGRYLGDQPVDSKGRWEVLAEPTKPGVETYDYATYTIQETAKFKSARSAGNMVANLLNHIGTPIETFNIQPGNWKCDDANIYYDGRHWYANLSWTLSGDADGWDPDIYD